MSAEARQAAHGRRRRRETALACAAFLLLATGAAGEPVVVKDVDKFRVMEPLFECVRVALASRGEEFSPAYIQGLSGAAFRIAGPCPCAPTCSVAMTTSELIRLLGYERREAPIGPRGPSQAGRWREALEQVRQEIRAGRPALVWNAFTNYEFDVACGYDEAKKRLLGRGSYAGNGGRLASADEMRPLRGADVAMPAAILIGRKTGGLDAREAELSALEEAVRHAHSARDRWMREARGVEKPWRFREGLTCYDVWIDKYRANPRATPGNGDRYCLGVYRSTHRSAAAFLKELLPKYPKARKPLERAAAAFAAEADALDQLRKLPGWNWRTKARPDPALAARAADLLQTARDRYAQGIDGVEQALREIAPERAKRARRVTRLRRGQGRVWIDFVGKLRWGKANTFAGALFKTLKVTDHPYAYAEIMGLTGLAFRVRWPRSDAKAGPSRPRAMDDMPDDMALAQRLMGWRLTADWTEARAGDADALRKKLVASIDAGKPVIAYPPAWTVGVVYGYEDGGKTLLVSDYAAKDFPARVPVEKLGPMRLFLGAWSQPPSLRGGFFEALRAAVENWRRGRSGAEARGREWAYGDAAFGAWIEDLRGFEKMTGDAKAETFRLDEHSFRSLFDARRNARRFLNSFSRLTRGDTRQALETAAKLYQKEVAALAPVFKDRRRKPRGPASWTAEERAREIKALTAARKLDAEAIAAIEKALRSSGARR